MKSEDLKAIAKVMGDVSALVMVLACVKAGEPIPLEVVELLNRHRAKKKKKAKRAKRSRRRG